MKIRNKYFLISLVFIIISLLHIFLNRNFSLLNNNFILLNFRLPRYILAITAGGVLAISGAIMQGILQNPLADSYLVGISGGAVLGNTIASIMFPGNIIISVVFSFIFGYIAFSIVLIISSFANVNKNYAMIIAGILISSLCSSIVTILYIVSAKTSVELFYTVMGTLNIVFLRDYIYLYIAILIIIFVSVIYIIMKSKEMDIISSGYEIAFTSGVNYKRDKNIFLFISAFIVSLLIAFTGIIGFVGIMVPHIIKRFIPFKYIHIFIFSFIGGGILLLFSDFIAKNFTSFEIPIGVITSLIGIPFFLFILRENKNI